MSAETRRQAFSPRGSNCPICKQEFRSCPHSVEQAIKRLDNNVQFEALKCILRGAFNRHERSDQ